MPWLSQWVPPAVMTEFGGVTVYHLYKDDEAENGPMTYWYSLSPNDAGESAFDVRELPGWPGDPKFVDYMSPTDGKLDWDAWQAELTERIRRTLHAAIDNGILKAEAAA